MVNSLSGLTQEHLTTSMKWMSMMTNPDRWNLTDEEVAALLGDIEVETYRYLQQRAKFGLPITMAPDTVERLSLLLGIWKAQQLLVPSERPELAFAWFNKRNSSEVLQNRSVKDYLLENNTLESFYIVRNYLNTNRY